MRISRKFVDKKTPDEHGAFTKAFSSLHYGKDDEKLIEVFDVRIKTPTRLVITDPVTKKDILHMPYYTDNIHSHLVSTFQIHSKQQIDENEEDRPVYDLNQLDRRQYDSQDGDFR